MADDGTRHARWMAAGTAVSMPLMAAVSATIGGPDGVAGILGGAAAVGAGIVVVRAFDRDEAASAAYELLDRADMHDLDDLAAGLREVA